MGKLFNSILCGLREAVGRYRRDPVLEQLRLENPTCIINSSNISHADLGEMVAILDHACLNAVHMGSFSYVECNSILHNVDVGSFTSIGPDARIGLARHPSKTFVSTYPSFYSNQNSSCPLSFRGDKVFDDSVPKTTIGNDVWIGAHVIIPGGVQIGTGAIVAAGSVVVKDIPPYAVVGGNPASIIRFRFSDEEIKVLLESEWWNWSVDTIRRHIDAFSDIKRFKEIATRS